MGLCKCPKRNITNQFCYEHRVNVCENCMVDNHQKCVVQSYLQWLQDSDYNPICEFCQRELSEEACVRLVCYHVVHWVCLDNYARQLPPDTAPAGYCCPSCNECVFPPDNLVSPVADRLKETLSDVNWARAGLGLRLLDDHSEKKPEYKIGPRPTPEGECLQGGIKPADSGAEGGSGGGGGGDTVISFSESKTSSRVQSSSSKLLTTAPLPPPPPILGDPDEDKYKRRNAIDWLSRWWRSSFGLKSRRRSSPRQRYVMAGLLVFLGFISLIVIFSYLGGRSVNNDPMLDPLNNPDIHISDE